MSAPHTHGGTDAPECTTCQPTYRLGNFRVTLNDGVLEVMDDSFPAGLLVKPVVGNVVHIISAYR